MSEPKKCSECPYRESNYIWDYCSAYGNGTVKPALTDKELDYKRPDWCTKWNKEE